MPLEILFLGTGTSAGVPMIGCHCAVCSSADPRDARTRPSVLISYPPAAGPGFPASSETAPENTSEIDGEIDEALETGAGRRRFLVDTAPEMRVQMIRHSIDRIDGVLYTHAHADHVFGLDDLRRFNAVMESSIDIYAETSVIDRLRATFHYIFESHKNVNDSFVASLAVKTIEAGVPLDLLGARWTPLRLLHGRLPVLGFRVDYPGNGVFPRGSLAYCTDVSAIPPETYPHLAGLDVLVIDGLRYRHHPTHFSVDQALEVIAQTRPRRAYLTHIAHDIMHAELEPRLPENVFIAFDGLVVRCGDESRS